MTDQSTYIDWNYDTKVAVRYARSGECNLCGGCCTKQVNIDVFDGNTLTHGGTATDGKKRWSEIETGEQSEFVRVWCEDNPWHKPCRSLGENNICAWAHDKPWFCSVFPTAPADIELFPDCSYVFTEIERWTFDD